MVQQPNATVGEDADVSLPQLLCPLLDVAAQLFASGL
jgi:hypothetical protein